MNWNPEGWFGLKSNNKVKLADPSVQNIDKLEVVTPELNLSTREFKQKLDELANKIDRSGDVDLIAVKKLYRTWNKDHFQEFSESDDTFLSLIDDFLSICGAFEAMEVTKQIVTDSLRSLEMINSIELQRELIKTIDESIDFDDKGEVVIKNEQMFSRIFATLEFLDNLSTRLIEKGGGSREFMPKKYLSGLRSMVCAFCLAKGMGAKVEFADSEFDQKYDLDMIVVKSDRRVAVDVTTFQTGKFDTQFGFQLFRNDSKSRIPTEVFKELNLTSAAKLMLPSANTNRECYSSKKGGVLVGLPSCKMIEGFKKVF